MINAVNRDGSGVLPNRSTLSAPYIDVNGDDALDPLDMLVLINAVNRLTGNGEGEKGSSNITPRFARSAFSPAATLGLVSENSTENTTSDELWIDLGWLLNDSDPRSGSRVTAKVGRRN